MAKRLAFAERNREAGLGETGDTIPGLFLRAVATHGSRPAVIGPGFSVSYDQLHDRVRKAVAALAAAGAAPGERIAVWLPNCAEWIEVGLAAACLGAVVVPISTRLKPDEVGYILNKARPTTVVAIGEFLGADYTRSLNRSAFPGVRAWFRVGSGSAEWRDWGAAVSSLDVEACTPVAEMANARKPDDIAEIMFTSGTTGFPKGAMLRHAQIVRAYKLWADKLGMTADDRYLIIAPMFHSFGYKAGVIASIAAGAAMYPLATFDAGNVLEIIETEKITVTGGPPTIFLALLAENKTAGRDINSLRSIGTGGNIVPPEMVRALGREARVTTVLNAYGLTESTALVTVTDPADEPERIAQTAGPAIDGVEVRCVDLNDRPVAPGEAGEIQCRGYNVMAGYFEDEEATRRTITPDGWLRTGDVGVLDAQGYLTVTDRMKDMYVVGGFNCYPAEIERLMMEHPQVDQVAVIGVPDDRWGEVGRAFVVPKTADSFDAEEFVAWCKQKMANYKVPRDVRAVSSLPRNAMGKMQKFLLRT